MCNINERTTLESVTVYKKVLSYKGEFYSPFAGTPIKVGCVIPQTDKTLEWCNNVLSDNFSDYKEWKNRFYNRYMVGKCNGFETLKDCSLMHIFTYYDVAILKIELGGDIMKGDAENIAGTVSKDAIIYAGSIIKSIEIIDDNVQNRGFHGSLARIS